MAPRRVVSRFLLPLSTAAWACGGDDLVLPPDEQPIQMEMVQGDEQIGRPGVRLAQPLVVLLADPSGVGIPNRTVLWIVKSGGGTVSPATGLTDAGGFASAEWVLGNDAGPNTLDAQVPSVGTVTFTATGTTDDAPSGVSAANSTIGVDPPSIEAGAGTATITVTVRDGDGAAVEGATVELQVAGNGYTLTQPSAATGADGIATGTLRSSTPGEKRISATVNGTVDLDQTASVTVTEAQQSRVDRLIFQVQPHDVRKKETFTVKVALVDVNGDVVPLSGIFIYLDLFEDGKDVPNNRLLRGEHFENTEDGVSSFDVHVDEKGSYRLEARTDDLPELGPHGPEPYLFSDLFRVN
jgi:hypothetical protein